MRTIKINLYQFEELSKEAKEKAIEKLGDINTSFDWWSMVYEDDQENTNFKLTGFDLGRGQSVEGDFMYSGIDTAIQIMKNHGETCESHKIAKAFIVKFDAASEPEDLEEDFRRDLLKDYLTTLRNEYEHLTSEEAIIETIEANEYEFTEEGEVY